MKELKLKYREYYSLKITDSNKNVINNVEMTGCQITTEQQIFSTPSYQSEQYDGYDEPTKTYIDGLMQGETRLLELKGKENLTSSEEQELKELEADFYGWTYVKISDENQFVISKDIFPDDKKTKPRDYEVPKHALRCELQVLERTPIKTPALVPVVVWEPVKVFGKILFYRIKQIALRIEWRKTGRFKETYRWADEFTIPRILAETLTFARYNVDINQRLLKNKMALFDGETPLFEIKNYRYKLTGGVVKIEKLQKEVIADEESIGLHGKNSYAYPESTLLEADAKVGEQYLIKHIGEHILEQYKDGRETMELCWQGDPTMTLGDNIVIEDKFGIERRYMITGNEFVLENSGKFYMRTEGISVSGEDRQSVDAVCA